MTSYASREVVKTQIISESSLKANPKVKVLDVILEATKKIARLSDNLMDNEVRLYVNYSKTLPKLNIESNKKRIKYVSEYIKLHDEIYKSFDIKKFYTNNSATTYLEYFHKLNIYELKEKYETHINKVKEIRDEKLDSLFSNSPFNTIAINEILIFLRMHFSEDMLNSLENNLKEAFSEDDETININYASFLNYLYILPSEKIQKADIAIDEDTGKIVIFYNSDENDYDSKKITLIPNEKDFTVSVISRKDGLAKFHGVYASRFPEAYYKIEFLMETLI